MFLTICTPTYNRSYTLSRLYQSLIDQSDQDFEWIVVDDGSTDDTKQLIKKWIKEDQISIKYIYQKNSGKHIALNRGVEISKGVLLTCVDSDDWLYTDAVQYIKKKWAESEREQGIIGLITLDSYENGTTIGDLFPRKKFTSNWIDLTFKYKVKGDKAFYIETNKLKKYPFPSFINNKHMPPSYQWYLLSENYNFILINRSTKYVEYLDDGISRNKYKKYIIAPDNFAYYRLVMMKIIPNIKRKTLNAIHFNSSQYLGDKKFDVKDLKSKLLVFMTKPLGFVISRYILYKNKNLKK